MNKLALSAGIAALALASAPAIAQLGGLGANAQSTLGSTVNGAVGRPDAAAPRGSAQTGVDTRANSRLGRAADERARTRARIAADANAGFDEDGADAGVTTRTRATARPGRGADPTLDAAGNNNADAGLMREPEEQPQN